jgi:hypothetical protein
MTEYRDHHATILVAPAIAGIDLVDEEVIRTILTDATSQLLTKKKDPDFAYITRRFPACSRPRSAR